MTASIKFLMILNDLNWFWSHRLPLARAIQKKGWKLHLATAGADRDQKLYDMKVTPFNLPAHGRSLNPLTHVNMVWAICRILRHLKPDVVHAITLRYAVYAGLAARLMGAGPIVFTIAGLGTLFTHHDMRSKILRAMVLPILKLAFARPDARIIFQNPDDARAFLNLNIVTENQTAIIRGSGVDMAEFTYAPEIEKPTPNILFPSRILKEKGIYDFIAAARILKAKGVRTNFQVAGGIDDTNRHSIAHAEMNAWVAEGLVEYLGNRKDMSRVMAECAIVALPSYYGEGVPKVLLEAAAMGRPIITCDMPGCREAVVNGVNGFLIPPKSPDILAERMETLINSKNLRAEMGLAGTQHVQNGFTAEIVTEQTMTVYEQIM